MQGLPDAGGLPIAEPAPAGDSTPAAQLLREQAPGCAGAQDEDDAAQGRAIRNARSATLRVLSVLRQEGLDDLPEIIRNA
jgi:hypothetical protein